jgi:hypothetical protein
LLGPADGRVREHDQPGSQLECGFFHTRQPNAHTVISEPGPYPIIEQPGPQPIVKQPQP